MTSDSVSRERKVRIEESEKKKFVLEQLNRRYWDIVSTRGHTGSSRPRDQPGSSSRLRSRPSMSSISSPTHVHTSIPALRNISSGTSTNKQSVKSLTKKTFEANLVISSEPRFVPCLGPTVANVRRAGMSSVIPRSRIPTIEVFRTVCRCSRPLADDEP